MYIVVRSTSTNVFCGVTDFIGTVYQLSVFPYIGGIHMCNAVCSGCVLWRRAFFV